MANTPRYAFTQMYDGLTDRLITDAVFRANDKDISVKALWDTGATGTCISYEVAAELGIKPVSLETIDTADGKANSYVYLVDVILMNNVTFRDILVGGVNIGGQGIGALIGMDIISCGVNPSSSAARRMARSSGPSISI